MQELEIARVLADASARAMGGDVDGAVELYDRVIAQAPKNGDAWRGKALALAGAGRYAESLIVLSHGVRAAPDDDRMAGLYITNLREMGRKDDAFAEAQKAIDRTPRSFWVLKAAGDTWRDRGDFSQAIRLYDRGLAIAPNDTMLMNGKATALFAAKDYEAAAQIYDRITDLRPDDFISWLNLGFVRENLGERTAARVAYGHALSIRPDNADALEGRAATSQTLAEAENYLRRLESIDTERANGARSRFKAA